MLELVRILVDRDGLSLEEAEKEASEVKVAIHEAMMNGEDPEEVFMDMTGLEPDYLEELLDY